MGGAQADGPTLVFIIGPPAVGKMTVGQALARRTGFRLFHLHQVLDLITEYFDYGSEPFLRLLPLYRALLFEDAAAAGMSLISTGAWQFDNSVDTENIGRYVRPYLACGGRVYVVELQATLETRLARNATENRRRHKKTDWSTEAHLRQDAATHRYVSGGVLPLDLPLLVLDTEQLSAESAAERICEHFHLPHARAGCPTAARSG